MPHKEPAGAHHRYLSPNVRRQHGYSKVSEGGNPELNKKTQLPIVDHLVTTGRMRNYTEEQIEEYIATGDPFDKAGAYGIQHPQFRPVAELDGCYLNVVGLPLCLLDRMLRQAGATPKGPAVPAAKDGHCAYCDARPSATPIDTMTYQSKLVRLHRRPHLSLVFNY